MKIKSLLSIYFVLMAGLSLSQSSVLSTGSWYKFSVSKDGVYKIDFALLRSAGINPSQINPKNLKIYTGQIGMLPQANNENRLTDLVEIPIDVVGETDGKFDADDLILFYGQGSDVFSYDVKSNFFSCQNNLFSDKNFYFLTISSSPGKRITQNQNIPGSYPIVSQYDDFAYYETDKYNLLHSGRQWFGEQFDQLLSLTIQFDIAGIVPNSDIKLTSHVMAQSITDCSFDLSFNNNAIINQPIAKIPNTQYDIKGRITADTITFNESTVRASSNTAQQIHYQFNRGTPGISVGYLDYFLFSVKRKLALYNGQSFFTSVESTGYPVSTFQINDVAQSNLVWDITNVLNTQNQTVQFNNGVFTFSTNTDSLKRFVVFDASKISKPAFESAVTNQNLHAITSADLLIISHPSLLAQATRLAAHRQSHDQLTVATATTSAIYNEYAGGKPDITAIRDFIRDVYKKSNYNLKYVLLFGRGSYDYKDRVFNNTNLVPIYESYESLNPLSSYSSDDYFGFLQDNEGEWAENPAVNYSMDVGIGRLPAKNLADAQNMVDKLIEYDTSPNQFGEWRKNFLFVADDGDYNLHENEADQLADNIEQNHSEFNTQKLFLDSYKQIMKPSGQFVPDATKALDLAIRKGKIFVNYTGHGSEQVWAQEQLLTPDLIYGLENAPKYPLFITATCDFGRNDDPSNISSAELLLLQKKGGGIGAVTTSRLVYSVSNFQLNQALYQALFKKNNNQFRRLGTIVSETKNNSFSGVSNRNFSLLGDPSMKLALADNEIVPTQIVTASGSDTLKALSQVTIKGEIQNNGTKLSYFNGRVVAALFDKNEKLTTLGDPQETVTPPSPPYEYVDRPNKLFYGSASVNQGDFQINFTMPSNLDSGFASGKLSLYAYGNAGTEAVGYSTSFSVGGREPDPQPDTTPPAIKLFVSDTTFINGGIIGANTKLVAVLSDKSGINIASTNPQNNLVATLDNRWSYMLNDYYESDSNNFQKGIVIYPLDTLKKGLHHLSLTASDNYNNQSTASIDFTVTEGTGIDIGDFYNFPNPFNPNYQTTSFRFTHTRAGEDLEANLIIYELTGRMAAKIDYNVSTSDYQVDLPQWNGESLNGTKLGAGIYVARLFVRSLADGSQNQKAVKLIILN
ncbi:MAG: type IX secretion system sortase PorU [Bacteroidetes bacterium]|nr:type IX secretion system sortase PorU [Bacteroidota bacterium]